MAPELVASLVCFGHQVLLSPFVPGDRSLITQCIEYWDLMGLADSNRDLRDVIVITLTYRAATTKDGKVRSYMNVDQCREYVSSRIQMGSCLSECRFQIPTSTPPAPLKLYSPPPASRSVPMYYAEFSCSRPTLIPTPSQPPVKFCTPTNSQIAELALCLLVLLPASIPALS